LEVLITQISNYFVFWWRSSLSRWS